MYPPKAAWKISLHGGHSGEFCEHAEGSLREMLEAAYQAGYTVFGVAEHMPRVEARFLYPKEIEWGWTPQTLEANFERYAHTITQLADEFADRLTVLRGFEIEVVPQDRYRELVHHYRQKYPFDYMVGSVHYLYDASIDGSSDRDFLTMMADVGGMEEVAVQYYHKVAEMAQAVRPEVIGHLDLVRLKATRLGLAEQVATARVRKAVEEALEVIRAVGARVEVNTSALRKGLDQPYPADWIVQLGARMGVMFCIGDDSHRPAQVGFGLEEARLHLLRNGVREVHFLTRENGQIVPASAPLEA
ncbi:MAG: putative histidinol-phosphatase [Fimbriimonadales bacterium]|nr:MAG: putative histidinol-phosphatase [Fimbriimonadales bacterium]